MTQLLPHLLWLGHAGDGRDFVAMLAGEIQALVQLAVEEPALAPPRELIYCRLPLVDGAGNDIKFLQLAAETVASFLEKRVKTLVVCGAGLSRAPAIAAAALALVYQETPEECLQKVAACKAVDVDPGFWQSIVRMLERERDVE